MKKLIIFIMLLVVLSILLGFLISSQISVSPRDQTEKAAFFSTETRGVCEELRESKCYYKCHDEVFLVFNNKEINIYRSGEYVCHEEGWVDPRIKSK
jgi:competence protein ComGF